MHQERSKTDKDFEVQPGISFQPFNENELGKLISGKEAKVERVILFDAQKVEIGLSSPGDDDDFFTLEGIDIRDPVDNFFTPQGEVSIGFTHLPNSRPVFRVNAFLLSVTIDDETADYDRIPREIVAELKDSTRFSLCLDEDPFYRLRGNGSNSGKMFSVILTDPSGLTITFY